MGELEMFLEHHGVKGQKWGIRNKRPTARASSDAKKAAELRGRPVHSMTNKQLKTLNERMNLEQNYARMSTQHRKSGKKRAEEILGTVGVGVTAYNLYNSPAGKASVALGKKVASKSYVKLAGAIIPKAALHIP